MAENPITVPLPADLPTNWVYGQTVAPDGSDVGLSQQHGYNYLMEQVNAAQQAAEELGEAFSGLASLDGTGKVPADELPDLDYDPAGSAAAVKEELENDLKTKMQHFGNITGYDTVLAAASALTVDGTFFGDPSSSIYNAADKPPGTTDVQYFVMLDGTTGQRVVLAVGYAATDEYRYFGTRDILNGAWLNEWKKLATVDELADKVGLAGNVSELGDMNLANIANQFYVIMESDAIQNLPYNSRSFNNSVVYNRGQENAVFTQTLYAPQLKTVYQRYYIGWCPEESRWSEWEQIATITSEPSTAGARAISAGTADLTAGSSALTTGQIYLVYG